MHEQRQNSGNILYLQPKLVITIILIILCWPSDKKSKVKLNISNFGQSKTNIVNQIIIYIIVPDNFYCNSILQTHSQNDSKGILNYQKSTTFLVQRVNMFQNQYTCSKWVRMVQNYWKLSQTFQNGSNFFEFI